MILENNLLPLHFSRILKKQDSGVKFICNPLLLVFQPALRYHIFRGVADEKILIWLAGLALLIAGCSATLNPKQQLKTTTATVQTQVQKEQAALKIIGDSVGAFPSTFEKAYQDHPDTDFRNDDGPVKNCSPNVQLRSNSLRRPTLLW